MDKYTLSHNNFKVVETDTEKIQTVMMDFKTRVDFKANPSILTRFNGVKYKQTRNYTKMHACAYITKILKDHGWSRRSKHDHLHRKPIHLSLLKFINPTTCPSMHNDPSVHQALKEAFGFDYRATLGEALYA